MLTLIEDKLDAIRALYREYGVARFEVFGSAMGDGFEPGRSDVDFLVTYPEGYDFGPWMGRVQDLEAAVAEVVGSNADLVMSSALQNRWFRREADKTRVVISDASEDAKVA